MNISLLKGNEIHLEIFKIQKNKNERFGNYGGG